ncbi:AAA family ATPase [Streptomyces sp. NPDC058246]|uniref:AAA family ATPase n=1 Tax=Streptomyces sp. NPDC058246 TaxID=3346400 RepID=UPI0036EAF423
MNRLTQKFQEALQEAQTAAVRMGQTEVDGEHLLPALLDQVDGLIPRLLQQAGTEPKELRGVPPGYGGYEEGGRLTEAVRRKPYSVVLFDEIEKAHTHVFNTLLHILDDGRITDAQGRTVDFRNTVIIMTSDIGSEHLLDGATAEGEIKPDARSLVMGELRGHFRPEFLNRVDDIVLFNPLGERRIERILELQFDELRQRRAERRITVELTDAAREVTAHQGYDPVYGARPLRRYISHEVETLVGRALLRGDVQDGATVRVDAEHAELVVTCDQPGDVKGARAA